MHVSRGWSVTWTPCSRSNSGVPHIMACSDDIPVVQQATASVYLTPQCWLLWARRMIVTKIMSRGGVLGLRCSVLCRAASLPLPLSQSVPRRYAGGFSRIIAARKTAAVCFSFILRATIPCRKRRTKRLQRFRSHDERRLRVDEVEVVKLSIAVEALRRGNRPAQLVWPGGLGQEADLQTSDANQCQAIPLGRTSER